MVYIDAAASQNPKMAAGAVVFKDGGAALEYTVFLGEMDNHEGEWAVLLFAVEKAVEHGFTSLIIHTDSKVVSDSFDRGFVKNPVFREYYRRIEAELDQFDLFLVSWKPRRENRRADELARDTLYRHKKG
ncbi:ribonuclease HI family protein [Salinicoccus carnicancri]|uniref:ribonuclease HI family protein n=1 Tax=Salinicoccus carnicancri TaxID=558170 RepID=UPI001FE12E5D|nr:ribonuclease HI family protein [Salinicoccus carnicancri]